jgi:predicted ABC-type ATPase
VDHEKAFDTVFRNKLASNERHGSHNTDKDTIRYRYNKDKEQLEIGKMVQINQAVKYGCQHFNIYLDNIAKWQNK